jgi:hypothetical protein
MYGFSGPIFTKTVTHPEKPLIIMQNSQVFGNLNQIITVALEELSI